MAMSGGVDSSVAAALLQKQGFFVVGGFMKNFSEESWSGVVKGDCPWEQDAADAKTVCDKLGIEFRSFNFEKEYADKVIEYFFAEYAAGRTPNPDVMCNKEIKFGLFLQKAMQLGFDFIATGHYARLRQEIPISKSQFPNKFQSSNVILLKGKDPKKDQSYFLYTLTQDQLAHSLFPIGECTKKQVRELAREFGLPNAEKKDSQGVCFVGHINLREFLKQRIPERVGEIVDFSGRVIGTHPGAWYYTVGQREGLGIGGTGPYYVAEKDVVNNRLSVANRLIGSNNLTIRDLHWIGGAPRLPLNCTAKIRYQQKDQACLVSQTNAKKIQRRSAGFKSASVSVRFAESQFAPAPGQSVVFYDGDQCLGGGIISE